MQPAIYTGAKSQTHKRSLRTGCQVNNSVETAAKPAFTGNIIPKKFVPLLAAAGASLLVLAGCGQQKPQVSISGGTGYVPPSYEEIVRSESEPRTSADGSPKDSSDDEQQNLEAYRTPGGIVYPSSTPKNESKDDTISAITEEAIKEQELYVKNQQLKSLDERLGDINAQLSDAQNRLETAMAELEQAEEKLLTYDRETPNDKPPGFEADYDSYVDIYNDVRGLESLILKLEADKAAAESKQDEAIARVVELGGHPHLD